MNEDERRMQALMFFSNCIKIKGLSDELIAQLYDETFLFDYASIFQLDRYEQEIADMIGREEYRKLWADIERSRHTTLDRVIAALGIPTVPQSAAIGIAEDFNGNAEEFTRRVTGNYDFTILLNYDDLIAWFDDPVNLEEWRALLKELIIEKPAPKPAAPKLPLTGLTIVPTGTLRNFTRMGIKTVIEANGGKCGSSVSRQTDFVLVGEKPGAKFDKGKSLGIPMISESDFLKMI